MKVKCLSPGLPWQSLSKFYIFLVVSLNFKWLYWTPVLGAPHISGFLVHMMLTKSSSYLAWGIDLCSLSTSFDHPFLAVESWHLSIRRVVNHLKLGKFDVYIYWLCLETILVQFLSSQCISGVFAETSVQLLKEFYKGQNPNGIM